MQKSAGLYDFVEIGELAETTLQLLALELLHGSSDGHTGPGPGERQVKRYVLQQARDYLCEVREGFVISVRTGHVPDRAELRFLLDRVLTDWDALSRELGLDSPGNHAAAADKSTGDQSAAGAEAGDELEQVRGQLLAFGMAAVALGQLPRLPAEQVTFPYSYGRPPTYADIDAPSSPGAMLHRIEEAAQTLWQIMAGDAHDLVKHSYAPLRRTYGFFEASAQLALTESERFGIKRRGSGLSRLL